MRLRCPQSIFFHLVASIFQPYGVLSKTLDFQEHLPLVLLSQLLLTMPLSQSGDPRYRPLSHLRRQYPPSRHHLQHLRIPIQVTINFLLVNGLRMNPNSTGNIMKRGPQRMPLMGPRRKGLKEPRETTRSKSMGRSNWTLPGRKEKRRRLLL